MGRNFFKLLVLVVSYFVVLATASQVQAEAGTVSVDYSDADSGRCVVLLHGLARTSSSMSILGLALLEEGYSVALVDYPSRDYSIDVLSGLAIEKGVQSCRENGNTRFYFVTHSLGGILIRAYLNKNDLPELERIVMLAPPNHGSAVVDNVKDVPGVAWLNGPAFLELGTDEKSVPLGLGEIKIDTAIIAGTRSINLFLSTFLDNPDDGKVSVESARLDGMCAMLVIAVSHPFIMKDEVAIKQTVAYLNSGKFSLPTAEYLDCDARQN